MSNHHNIKHNKALVGNQGKLIAQQQVSYSSAPYPNAEELAKLHILDPKLVERVMIYVETEQKKRHEINLGV